MLAKLWGNMCFARAGASCVRSVATGQCAWSWYCCSHIWYVCMRRPSARGYVFVRNNGIRDVGDKRGYRMVAVGREVPMSMLSVCSLCAGLLGREPITAASTYSLVTARRIILTITITITIISLHRCLDNPTHHIAKNDIRAWAYSSPASSKSNHQCVSTDAAPNTTRHVHHAVSQHRASRAPCRFSTPRVTCTMPSVSWGHGAKDGRGAADGDRRVLVRAIRSPWPRAVGCVCVSECVSVFSGWFALAYMSAVGWMLFNSQITTSGCIIFSHIQPQTYHPLILTLRPSSQTPLLPLTQGVSDVCRWS